MEDDKKALPPHVLIFPLPFQGPVNSMLKLAELLSLSGDLHVTFLATNHILTRLQSHNFTRFTLDSISDGLPDDHPRSGDQFMEIFDAMEAVTKPLFRDMLISGGRERRQPVTCIIADGILSFSIDVAEEIGIPIICTRTVSPCCLWVCFCLPKLVEAGEVPFEGNDLDAPIKGVPGMEEFLRRRDLPSLCRAKDKNEPLTQLVMKESQHVPRCRGLILNTFEELDGPILSHIRSLCPILYPIGPLHSHLKMRLKAEATPPPISSNSLWQEDTSCITWLETQPSKSVVYISIGSLAMMTSEQLIEFWHGLVNSGHRFLWVRRPNSIAGEDWEGQISRELLEATKERGFLVSWAPQEEVLAHPAIGGFLTHSGWNSTLESIVEGVPMVCWPYFGDQQVNSRYVSEVWKLGIDMKDMCDRVVIEKMIKDLMDARRDEFMQSRIRMAKLAKESVSEGGSSFCNLNRLIEDIKLMNV